MGGLRLWKKRVYVCGLKKFYVFGWGYVCGWFYVCGKKGFMFVVKFYVCGWFTFVGVTTALFLKTFGSHWIVILYVVVICDVYRSQ